MAVTFSPVDDTMVGDLGDLADVRSTVGAPDDERARTLEGADVLFSWNYAKELRPGEGAALGARFVQLISAGADHLAFDQLPRQSVVASNVGAYAEPMAEHVLSMALALLKQLPQGHAKLASGIWDQSMTRRLSGSVCGVLGFGGIGRATARRMQALGARIYAVNTGGRTTDTVEFVGTLDQLDTVLKAADVLVLCLPLTRRTRGLIGKRELELMKPDAVLVNVGRGGLVVEDDLYDHLRRHPEFSAGIDTWWGEPFRGGQFSVHRPFFELPNFIGSPHNSALVPGALHEALSAALSNIRRFLRGEPVTGIVRSEDYVANSGAAEPREK
ncbi:MAG TPA: 2-hydroxyacid dehydrogenase [Acidimicrobiales bacterium]|nr:2-hydroxyacid dehydrogenase [Acidimicrobiales bacterium]